MIIILNVSIYLNSHIITFIFFHNKLISALYFDHILYLLFNRYLILYKNLSFINRFSYIIRMLFYYNAQTLFVNLHISYFISIFYNNYFLQLYFLNNYI